ncbi:MAG: hypothetical protein MK165_05955, partial [Pirellulaceae bacterium]|nr:hypothetical protein [Pirellulaceae bacterium]
MPEEPRDDAGRIPPDAAANNADTAAENADQTDTAAEHTENTGAASGPDNPPPGQDNGLPGQQDHSKQADNTVRQTGRAAASDETRLAADQGQPSPPAATERTLPPSNSATSNSATSNPSTGNPSEDTVTSDMTLPPQASVPPGSKREVAAGQQEEGLVLNEEDERLLDAVDAELQADPDATAVAPATPGPATSGPATPGHGASDVTVAPRDAQTQAGRD